MGVVWRATHNVTRKLVALKFLQTTDNDPRLRRRFLREARAASAVRHRNVVEIHDVVELDDGTPAMVMEFLEGETLGDLLDREQVMPLENAARVLLPVVSAVGTAHAAGVVHRDLKPDNIFLARSSTSRRLNVKVLDFGIAKLLGTEVSSASTAALTGTGTLLGTPYYMSPEQVFGERDIDHRCDIWALGVILYECLSGKRPAEGDNVGQIMKIITHRNIVPIERVCPDLPEDVTKLVGSMLSVERADRPQSLHIVREVLRAHLGIEQRRQNDGDDGFELPVAPPAPRNSLADVSGEVALDRTLEAPTPSRDVSARVKTLHDPPAPRAKTPTRIVVAVAFGLVLISAFFGVRNLLQHHEDPKPAQITMPPASAPTASATVSSEPVSLAHIETVVVATSSTATSVGHVGSPSKVASARPAVSQPSATHSAAPPPPSPSFGTLVDKPPF
jgi:serine/threonine protein kinase